MKQESRSTAESIAPMLGWFSLGLGLAEVLAPRAVVRSAGMDEDRIEEIRMCGIREIMSGLGVLSDRTRPAGLWSRVAGDAMDLGLLARDLNRPGAESGRLGAAAAAVLGISALDLYCAIKESNGGFSLTKKPLPVREVIAVNKPIDQVWSYWRDLTNLPKVMSFIDSVQVQDEKRSHWKVKPPLNMEWNSVITEDKPNERLSWRSVEGSDIEHTGSVSFRPLPGGRGTAVTVELAFALPGIAHIGSSAVQSITKHKVYHDLRRFKQILETGEEVSTRGQPAGRPQGETKLDIAARM